MTKADTVAVATDDVEAELKRQDEQRGVAAQRDSCGEGGPDPVLPPTRRARREAGEDLPLQPDELAAIGQQGVGNGEAPQQMTASVSSSAKKKRK